MSFRTTLVFLVLAVALGAYVWVYERDPLPDPTKPTEALVFDETFVGPDVEKIEITGPDGSVALERAGEAKWKLAQPPGARADKLQADSVADTLAGLKSANRIDAPKSLTDFGLEKPAIEIQMRLKGKPAPRHLLVGDKTVDNASVYVKRADAATVWTIPTTLHSQVSKKPEDWRDKSLASVEFNDVVGVEIEREADKLAFEKQGERWMMTEPMKIPASKDEVEGVIRDASGLRVEKFVQDGVQSDALGQFGLDHPRVAVRLRVGGTASTQVLFGAAEPKPTPTPTPKVGKGTPAPPSPTPTEEPVTPGTSTEKVYAKLADESSIYLVSGGPLTRLQKSAQEFYSLQPFVTQQWQTQRVELRLEELTLVLAKDDKSEWRVEEPAGKTVEYGQASSVLSAVYGLRFEGVAAEGSVVEEKARLVVGGEKKDDSAAPTETLILGAAAEDGVRLAQRPGEGWVYRVKDADLAALRTAAREVLAAEPTPSPIPPEAAASPAGTPVASSDPAGTPPSIEQMLVPPAPTPP